jgi:hypothetical protein
VYSNKGGLAVINQEFPEFSWSFSRHKTAMECLTKYFRSYYGSHNGWLKHSDAITKHIYRLKKLTNLEMLLGERVHKFIEDTAKRNHTGKEKEVVEHIWTEIERAIDSSFKNHNHWYERPGKYTMLQEVYYENTVSNEKLSGIREKLEKIIYNLYQNEVFIKLIEKKIMIKSDTEQFRFMNNNGIKIWLRLDLHYFDQTQDHWVVDWKTGKLNENDRNQLALYAHFVSRAYRVKDLSKIKIRNEYLLNKESKSYSINPIDIENMKEVINTSIHFMQSFLDEVENNIPLHESCFSQTSNQNVCSRCNFKEMCGI